jgi:hypothetical protein
MSILKFGKGLVDNDGKLKFKPLPAGTYKCRITKIEEKKSGENSKYPGMPYLNFKACIAPGEEHEGKPFFFMVSLPHDIMDEEDRDFCITKMKRLMNACQIEAGDEGQVDTSDFIGQELNLVVIETTYKNEPKNEVKDYLPLE